MVKERLKSARYEMEIKSANNTWHEELEGFNGKPAPTNLEDAKAQDFETIEYFNSTLRAGETSRKVVSIREFAKIERISDYAIIEKQRDKLKFFINKDAVLVQNPDGKTYYDGIDISWDLMIAQNKINNFLKAEIQAGTYYAKLALNRLHIESKGEQGKSYMACSPKKYESNDKRRENTKYDFYYWLNYGDGTTYGAFTVEQVYEWLHNDVLLADLGGTSEYIDKTNAQREAIQLRKSESNE